MQSASVYLQSRRVGRGSKSASSKVEFDSRRVQLSSVVFLCPFYPVRTEPRSQGLKLLGREAEPSPPISAEINNAWRYIYISASPYVFVASVYVLVQHLLSDAARMTCQVQ
jgi:hypothetical protein